MRQNKKRTLLILTKNIYTDAGGMAIANFNLIKALSNKYRLIIINCNYKNDKEIYKNKKIIKNYSFETANLLKKIYSLKKLICDLKEINKKYPSVTIIFSTTFLNLVFYQTIIRIFNLFKKSFTVYWCHINPYHTIPKFYRNKVTSIIFKKFFYDKIDLIITTDSDMESIFKNQFYINKNKIKTINYALRYNFKELIKEKIKTKYKRPIIITMTRLTNKFKDLKTLIKSLAIVKQNIEFTLLILGKGDYKNKLLQLINKYNLNKNIKLVGFKKNPFPYLKIADLFVLSSKVEGSPISLIEAQALSIPIVSTNCPTGPKYILQNGKLGSLVKTENQMAKAIIKNLIKKDNRKIQKGLAFNKKNFSFKLFKNKWNQTLDNIIKNDKFN